MSNDSEFFKEDSSTRSWDKVADDWLSHADTNDYRLYYLMPRMLAMVGEVAGKKVLDLGCGEGGYTRELARLGADVTGVDGSARLIEIAKKRRDAAGVRAHILQANASEMPQVESASFDLVVAPMSLMDVEDYPGAVSEVWRVLRPGGTLAMSITHPCFSARVAQWVRGAGDGLEVFAVDRYFERGAWESYITTRFRSPVLRRHRPLEDYIAEPIRLGMQLRRFSEAEATAEEIQLSSRFAKLARIPYFLFMMWAKQVNTA